MSVALIDVVKLECLNKPDSPEHAAMNALFHNKRTRVGFHWLPQLQSAAFPRHPPA